ncbi:MAG: histidine phosphotransferase family protein [Paracoccus sp. (in: a-proteobacteria)]|nr:histidine phosphotransferase family protein [Paracoccus sp. (in: a-proteobacteria)]
MKDTLPTPADPAQMTALLASRLCHDIISPLGAIGNGVELLQMTPDYPGIAQSPEMMLIAESVEAARARIRAFRMAFGTASDGQRVSQGQLAEVIDDLNHSARLRVSLETGDDLPRADVKLVMLALMCMATAMPWGGRVTVTQNLRHWTITGEADRTQGNDRAVWAWLDADQPDMPDAAHMHFAVLGVTARAMGHHPRWSRDETRAVVAW